MKPLAKPTKVDQLQTHKSRPIADSSSQEMIEKARKLSGISLNSDAEQFLSIIYRSQFDKLRYFVARLMDISVTYYVVVPKSLITLYGK